MSCEGEKKAFHRERAFAGHTFFVNEAKAKNMSEALSEDSNFSLLFNRNHSNIIALR